MIMRKMSLYQLTRGLVVEDLNDLNKALSFRAQRKISAMELSCDGFLPPMKSYRDKFCLVTGRNEVNWYREEEDPSQSAFIQAPFPLSGFTGEDDPTAALVIMYYREEKVIVSSDVKRRVKAKVEEIEEDQQRKVYPKERSEIKDTVVASVLPHAQSRLWAAPIIFCDNGLVIVGETGKRADLMLSELRTVLGTLPITPLTWGKPIPEALTDLARSQLEGGYGDHKFRIINDFQMQELHEHPEIARMKNTDIANPHVQSWMEEGKVVTHADLSWNDQMTFRLDFKGVFSKLKVDDGALEEVEGEEEGDCDSVAQAHFAGMMIELGVINRMLESFSELVDGIVTPRDLNGKTPQDQEPTVLYDMSQRIDNTRAGHDQAEGADDEDADA